MNFKQIIDLITQDMNDVNSKIHKKLNSKVILINKISNYIINGGGKRIRPIISLLVAKALNYKGKQHVNIATFIEFIHTATLLHDDVIDNSELRHGKTTANINFGNAASILVGDFIYTKAFQMMTELKSLKILSLISKALNVIAEGEILQLTHCNNPDLTIKDYMKIIYSKTAKLFEVTSQSSAILAGANNYQELALKKYGKYLGTAFQLINDLMDYISNKEFIGKNKGNDLNEGKITLPLLHAIKNSTSIRSSFIRQAIKLGNNKNLLNMVLETMHQCGSLEYTHKYAKNQVNKAISYLDCLSISPYKNALKSLAKLTVNYY